MQNKRGPQIILELPKHEGSTRGTDALELVTRVSYRSLDSVAWVNRTWVVAVILLTVAVNVLTGLFEEEAFWGIEASLVLLGIVLVYPYYHYRVSGGYVKRIAPRFATWIPVFERNSVRR